MPERPEARVTYLIGRFDRVVRRRFEEALDPFGVTLAQYTALSVLASKPGLTNAQLARRALVSPQGMNQALAALADKGMIRRKRRARMGRQLEVHLTAKGKHLVERCRPAADEVEADMLAPLAPADRDRLLDYLLALTDLGAPDADATPGADGVDLDASPASG